MAAAAIDKSLYPVNGRACRRFTVLCKRGIKPKRQKPIAMSTSAQIRQTWLVGEKHPVLIGIGPWRKTSSGRFQGPHSELRALQGPRKFCDSG